MVFHKYAAQLKLVVVHLLQAGRSFAEVRRSLPPLLQPSNKSMQRWLKLWADTNRVIRDPALYAPLGRKRVLTAEHREFIKELIEDDSAMYLDEVQWSLYDEHGIFVSLSTISL